MSTTMTKELQPHPLAAIIPPMSEAEFEDLKEDIRVNGQMETITTCDGMILDGRHRYRACRELGLRPITNFLIPVESPLAFVVAKNLHRRHLSESQRAMVAARLVPEFKAEARANMSKGGQGLADLPTLHTRDRAARALRVSPRLAGSAAVVSERGVPALVAAVDRDEVKVSAAAAVAGLDPAEQERLVAAGPRSVRDRAADLRRAGASGRRPAPDDEPAAGPMAVAGATAVASPAGNPAEDGVAVPPTPDDRQGTGETLRATPGARPSSVPAGVHRDAAGGNTAPPPPASTTAEGGVPYQGWLETLPARAALAAHGNTAAFDEDALLWLACQPAVSQLRGVREPNRADVEQCRVFAWLKRRYSHRVASLTAVRPPEEWPVCSQCRGSGRSPSLKKDCDWCAGAGFDVVHVAVPAPAPAAGRAGAVVTRNIDAAAPEPAPPDHGGDETVAASPGQPDEQTEPGSLPAPGQRGVKPRGMPGPGAPAAAQLGPTAVDPEPTDRGGVSAAEPQSVPTDEQTIPGMPAVPADEQTEPVCLPPPERRSVRPRPVPDLGAPAVASLEPAR